MAASNTAHCFVQPAQACQAEATGGRSCPTPHLLEQQVEAPRHAKQALHGCRASGWGKKLGAALVRGCCRACNSHGNHARCRTERQERHGRGARPPAAPGSPACLLHSCQSHQICRGLRPDGSKQALRQLAYCTKCRAQAETARMPTWPRLALVHTSRACRRLPLAIASKAVTVRVIMTLPHSTHRPTC